MPSVESHSYLTGVTAAQLRWHPSDMNAIFDRYFGNVEKRRKSTNGRNWFSDPHPWGRGHYWPDGCGRWDIMTKSSHENHFRIIDPLCGGTTSQWRPLPKWRITEGYLKVVTRVGIILIVDPWSNCYNINLLTTGCFFIIIHYFKFKFGWKYWYSENTPLYQQYLPAMKHPQKLPLPMEIWF